MGSRPGGDKTDEVKTDEVNYEEKFNEAMRLTSEMAYECKVCLYGCKERWDRQEVVTASEFLTGAYDVVNSISHTGLLTVEEAKEMYKRLNAKYGVDSDEPVEF